MYYQPREHRNISICGAADIQCIRKVEQEIQSEQNSSFKCDQCLSGCFAITYDYAFSTAKIFEQIPFLQQNNLEINNVAILHTYYSRSSFRSERKEELVGFTDFLCKFTTRENHSSKYVLINIAIILFFKKIMLIVC